MLTYITLVGPNAIGKTTAVRRWVARYSKLVAISADLQLVFRDGEETRQKGWSGTAEQKQQLVDEYQSLQRVVVVESARTDILRFSRNNGFLLLVTCSAESHRQHLIQRCTAKEKKFRDDYWTLGKCAYESQRRYVNSAKENFDSNRTHMFTVNDQERDWPVVDEYFGQLFRRLHNQIVRSKNAYTT